MRCPRKALSSWVCTAVKWQRRHSGLCIAESRAAEIESHAEQHVRRIHSTLSKQIAKGMPSDKEEMARRLKKILQSGEAGLHL